MDLQEEQDQKQEEQELICGDAIDDDDDDCYGGEIYIEEVIIEPEIIYEKNCLAELKQQTDCIGTVLQFICPFECAYRLSLVCKDWVEIIKKQQDCKIEFNSYMKKVTPYHKFCKSNFFNNAKELRMYGRNGSIVNKVINCPKSSKLEKLELYSAGPKSAFHISSSENVSGLTSLKFNNSRILNLGAIRIVECEKLSNLKELHLPKCKVNVNFVAKLANSKYMSKLTELNLEGNNLRAEGVKLLANSPNLANLTSLNLRRNRVGKDGAMYLATSQYLTQLTKLDLNGNSIEDEGLSFICANMRNLTSLDLSGNLISDEGIRMIADSENMTKLQDLYLFNNSGNRNFRIRPVENTYSESASSVLSNSPYLKNLEDMGLNFD